MTYTPTPAEIEAGAEALAGMYFVSGSQIPLSEFAPAHQQRFRNQARAVLEAAARVRSEARIRFAIDFEEDAANG